MPHAGELQPALSFDRFNLTSGIRPPGTRCSIRHPFVQLDPGPPARAGRRDPQAFDAADEYLLNQLHERGVTAQCRVLVLNDAFGALAASLLWRRTSRSPAVAIRTWASLALRKNLARNGCLDLGSVRFVPASETAVGPFRSRAGRVPKTSRSLEEQLIRPYRQPAPGAQVRRRGDGQATPRAAGDLLNATSS